MESIEKEAFDKFFLNNMMGFPILNRTKQNICVVLLAKIVSKSTPNKQIGQIRCNCFIVPPRNDHLFFYEIIKRIAHVFLCDVRSTVISIWRIFKHDDRTLWIIHILPNERIFNIFLTHGICIADKSLRILYLTLYRRQNQAYLIAQSFPQDLVFIIFESR